MTLLCPAAIAVFISSWSVASNVKAKPKDVDPSTLEREIDDMVYRLYGLTYDEVKTIEPEYSLSREEYEATA